MLKFSSKYFDESRLQFLDAYSEESGIVLKKLLTDEIDIAKAANELNIDVESGDFILDNIDALLYLYNESSLHDRMVSMFNIIIIRLLKANITPMVKTGEEAMDMLSIIYLEVFGKVNNMMINNICSMIYRPNHSLEIAGPDGKEFILYSIEDLIKKDYNIRSKIDHEIATLVDCFKVAYGKNLEKANDISVALEILIQVYTNATNGHLKYFASQLHLNMSNAMEGK